MKRRPMNDGDSESTFLKVEGKKKERDRVACRNDQETYGTATEQADLEQ